MCHRAQRTIHHADEHGQQAVQDGERMARHRRRRGVRALHDAQQVREEEGRALYTQSQKPCKPFCFAITAL